MPHRATPRWRRAISSRRESRPEVRIARIWKWRSSSGKARSGSRWRELTDTVVKLDSFDYPQAYFLNALSNYYLKNIDAAEKSAREAVRLDTRKQFLTTIRCSA